jgi:hypothetical protein
MTPEVMQAALDDVLAIENLSATQSRWMGEAQTKTKRRNATFVRLNRWVKELKTAARLSLTEEPQLLEKLGIFVRSSPKRPVGSGDVPVGSSEVENPVPEDTAEEDAA